MTVPQLPFEARPEMHHAINAALSGGAAILKFYGGSYQTRIRENEPVTEADTESHKVITDILTPTNIPILSEEGEQKIPESEQLWTVDPLDGTHEFINKTGDFNVMISLIEKGIPTIGVLYCPTENKLYVAEKGKGAYMLNISEQNAANEWKKLSVTSRNDIRYARAFMSRAHLTEEEQQILRKLNVPWTKKGSALKTAEISAGNAELYFTLSSGLSIWDTAAVYRILKESGGRMTDSNGNKLSFRSIKHKEGIVATNKHIHDQLISMIERNRNTIVKDVD